MIKTDVTDEESCKNAVKKTMELFGSVNILVNIGKRTPISEGGEECVGRNGKS